ncbi:hypothetical protein BY996DRAFT_8281493 [Phakopsora pachyrhizi]|nr:hypothetical protein BY996DRAFT_8281493 [Phakopsora pachyrhizi]
MLFDRAQFKVLFSFMILVQTFQFFLQAAGMAYMINPPPPKGIKRPNGPPVKNPFTPHIKYGRSSRDRPKKKSPNP